MSMCNQYKSIHCLDKQIGFNTAPVAQYCSVAVKELKSTEITQLIHTCTCTFNLYQVSYN